LEIILVDDGSTDKCPEICDEYTQQDGRVKVIHKINGGVSDARNAGLDMAKGEYISFVYSDDYILDDMLFELYKAVSKTKADMAICDIITVEESGKLLQHEKVGMNLYNTEEFWKYRYEKHPMACMVAWNKLYHHKIFKDIRYEYGRIHEEEIILPLLVSNCKNIVTTSNSAYVYVHRKGSITHSNYTVKNLQIVDDRLKMFNHLLCAGLDDFALIALKNVFSELKHAYICLDLSEEEVRAKYRDYLKKFNIEKKKIRLGKKKIIEYSVLNVLPVNNAFHNMVKYFYSTYEISDIKLHKLANAKKLVVLARSGIVVNGVIVLKNDREKTKA
jgi:glycosyltransferase involved in cell wall biosynthesis